MIAKNNIFVGPAGWSYPDWNGIVYPKKKPRGFSELEFLSQYFNTIEINSTFYRIPAKSHTEKWINVVNYRRQFRFCVKLWRGFTHENNKPSKAERDSFRDVMMPMLEHEKMGVLLIQFPWRFKKTNDNVNRVLEIASQFQDFPRAVEFRHKSWLIKDVVDILRERDIAFTNIDQPVIGNSIEPSAHVTSNFGYVRLHGRNYQNWFKKDAGRDARYDYLYPKKELDEWRQQVEKMTDQAASTFVIFNNHFRGQAVINGLEFLHELNNEKIKIPAPLLKSHPSLSSIASNPEDGGTLELF